MTKDSRPEHMVLMTILDGMTPGIQDSRPHPTHEVDPFNNPIAHNPPEDGQENPSGVDHQLPPVHGGNAPTRPSSAAYPRPQSPQLFGWR